jgi:hypothetical protein
MVKRRTYKRSRAAMLKTLILAAAAFLFFASCTTIEGAYPDGSKLAKSDSHPFGNKSEARTAAAYADGKEAEGEIIRRGDRELLVSDGYIFPTQIQEMIVNSGIRLTETGNLVVNGQEFPADCTGTVLAAYWGAGLNPVKYFHLYSGNGVQRLNDMGEDYGLNYMDALPSPGDVIIWDNTYDKDGDGKWGDPYTHAGVVISVSENGQITYLHYNYAKGVVLEKMNLIKPDEYTDENGELVNSPLRLRADRHIKPDAWLASHLVRGFIPLYEYPGIGD